MRSRIPLAAALIALAGAPQLARAQTAQERGAEEPIELAPPRRIHRTGDAIEWVASMLNRIADRQRFGPRETLGLPPLVNGPSASPWLPDGRTGLPYPGERVRPVARAHGIELAPFAIETLNTQVAESRGSDGLAVGIRITLPSPP